MDELSGLLAQLDAPPDTVWMRVLANALDPDAVHADLSDLVPDAGDPGAWFADPDELFADDPAGDDAGDDAGPDPYGWLDGVEEPGDDLDGGPTEVADPDQDDPDDDPDVS